MATPALEQSEPKRYLRQPRVVLVRALVPPESSDDEDMFLVMDLEGKNEYAITRKVLNREYKEMPQASASRFEGKSI